MSATIERHADIVVVGAGIGFATGYYPAWRGVRTVVVERGTVFGGQSRKHRGFAR